MPERIVMLNVWMALGGTGQEFETWMSEDARRSNADAWAQLLSAIRGDWAAGDTNPPPGSLLALRNRSDEAADEIERLRTLVVKLEQKAGLYVRLEQAVRAMQFYPGPCCRLGPDKPYGRCVMGRFVNGSSTVPDDPRYTPHSLIRIGACGHRWFDVDGQDCPWCRIEQLEAENDKLRLSGLQRALGAVNEVAAEFEVDWWDDESEGA